MANPAFESERQPTQQDPATPWWRRLLAGRFGDEKGPELVFPKGFLKSLERLRILSLRAAGGGLKEGRRLGAYKGGQLEFHDHRAYAPGDDLRYLDWNLYARLGRPFVKEFAREEAGCIHIMLDATASMQLGQPSKWTFARRLAVLFAHIAWGSRDLVQAHIFRDADGTLETYPPRGFRGNIKGFMEWLQRPSIALRPLEGIRVESAEGILLKAVSGLLRAGASRGRVFILSDFWQEETEVSDSVRRLVAAGFEVSAFHILAPEELLPARAGELRVLSVEEAGEVEVNATANALVAYEQQMNAHIQAIAGLFLRRGGQHLLERSDTSMEHALLRTLKQRRWIA